MEVIYGITGTVIFVLVIADIIKTVFSTRGAGSLSSAVIDAVWAGFFKITGKKGSAKLLEYAGPTMLVVVLAVWVIGLWLGFYFVLLADPNSIVASSTEIPATPVEKFYYAGFTLSTLGVGDYKASSDLWRVLTSCAAFTGLAFITTAITYFVQVLSAVSLQNQLSLYINSMGATPQQILLNSWTGTTFDPFYSNVSSLSSMLMKHITNHHSFPVVHYFHSSDPKLSVTPALVRLDEACQLLRCTETAGSPERQLALHMLRQTLDTYAKMVGSSFLAKSQPSEQPPHPDLTPFAKAGIEVDRTRALTDADQQRRDTLTALLEHDGWSWKNVYG